MAFESLAIQTHGLTKRFGARVVVADLNLRVPAGQITGFLGPNGAGKSTTIAMLVGLTRPSAGRITLLGLDAAHHRPAIHRRLGVLLEAPAVYTYLTVRENLLVQARLARQDPASLPDLLDRLGLIELAERPARGLSLGQRQRLGLAGALLGQPDLLILDEPTNGLDPVGLRQTHDLLRAFARGGGTVILSSHRLIEVQELCTHVVMLAAGRLVAQGPAASLLGDQPAQRLLLRVDDPERAVALLTAAAWPVALTQDAIGPLVRVVAPAGRASEVNALLTAHAIGVAELRAEQSALEDLYLNLTGAAHG